MNASTILHIYFITYPDKIDIPSYYRTEPNTAIITHDHIPNNGGIRCNETVFSELRIFVFNRKYDSHGSINIYLVFLFDETVVKLFVPSVASLMLLIPSLFFPAQEDFCK